MISCQFAMHYMFASEVVFSSLFHAVDGAPVHEDHRIVSPRGRTFHRHPVGLRRGEAHHSESLVSSRRDVRVASENDGSGGL